ncbi:methyltransferase domain-containing protein [Phycicoccus endophyticus]|uniref:Methyltransferase domain-containing protein n=1 Tax=Phycicoccus endophyticus TaxID=1690220 RepID=A0A7G9R0J5_9MICO|nr:methyltransferase domain-containing protein [Phycicoccus endophyticus]NHI19397.1 methyltransferase domain-containing protein [Phycicoccus endophyticus]QNN49120.1 methyltransferase domain-containing protein [Phycicoccus endophyticus]GGL38758.1 ubiquinone/menaquinone biosynthesis methyltransferase [Phycicoccus endophyticus]
MPREWLLAEAFDRAAPTYDAMVALSPGYHEQLRCAAAALVEDLPERDGRAPVVLDLGCGSGASTRALLETRADDGGGPLEVTGVDASTGMVTEALAKGWPEGVWFTVADAVEHLGGLPDASVDGVLAAYLLRNVPERQALVEEVARVLRPGGVLVVHDYSVAGSVRARAVWAAVCHTVIIPLAALKRSDVPLHRYLYTSVRDFDSVAQVCRRLQRAGLVDVRHRSYPGWQDGVVHTVVGRRAP